MSSLSYICVVIQSYMFSRFPALLPILETDYVVNKIIEAILTNQKALYIPKILYVLMALKG